MPWFSWGLWRWNCSPGLLADGDGKGSIARSNLWLPIASRVGGGSGNLSGERRRNKSLICKGGKSTIERGSGFTAWSDEKDESLANGSWGRPSNLSDRKCGLAESTGIWVGRSGGRSNWRCSFDVGTNRSGMQSLWGWESAAFVVGVVLTWLSEMTIGSGSNLSVKKDGGSASWSELALKVEKKGSFFAKWSSLAILSFKESSGFSVTGFLFLISLSLAFSKIALSSTSLVDGASERPKMLIKLVFK